MKKIYYKYQEIINYMIFGFLTTCVSLISYYILSIIFNIENNIVFILINSVSWILSVLFAYYTNKFYVFKKKNKSFLEMIKFFLSRLSTYFIDILCMFIFVKMLVINNFISKVIVQIIVIILNYIFSKIIVFKK